MCIIDTKLYTYRPVGKIAELTKNALLQTVFLFFANFAHWEWTLADLELTRDQEICLR